MSRTDGIRYAPDGKAAPAVSRGEFVFAAAALDHGHIFSMSEGLCGAGGTLKWVYDPDPAKTAAFRKRFPEVREADCLERILEDPEVRLCAGAAVPSRRCALGIRCMEAGKDYFTDKAPFTALEQVAAAREAVRRTGRKYMVYYSERLHSESAVHAGRLIADGAIGDVIQVIGLGPHRLSASPRPDWFFRKEQYGGILCDIGSHQIEQYLFYAGEEDARVVRSHIANYAHPEHPELEDFGEAMLAGARGTSNYFRVDWFTPDGLGTWGDGRTTILGTRGYIEMRKYIDVAREKTGDHLYLVNGDTEEHIPCAGRVGYPFFGQLILDVLERTENAMTQEHAFRAAELCLIAERDAVRLA